MPDLCLESALGGRVAGIDEAGRGPLAGPVVAAAVVLDQRRLPADVGRHIDDSKRLAPDVREWLFDALQDCASIGIGIASPTEIDRLNILNATFLAMRRAAAGVPGGIGHALVDGNRAPALPCPATAVVGGDGIALSVAAASVVAKVIRDRIMRSLARIHPRYGWETNVGYGTPAHLEGLALWGPTHHHRRSFKPVALYLK